MPLIWCAISGHGFGHAAQVIPVLNALGKIQPHLKVILRTQVPEAFFHNRLHVPWEMSPSIQDIGCIQQGPLTIDELSTWKAYEKFHRNWDEKIQEEVKIIRASSPDLLLSNISYFAIEAGKSAGIPTIGLGSLSWDQILRHISQDHVPSRVELIHHIQKAYSHADLFIRVNPGMQMTAFPSVIDVGPVVQPLQDRGNGSPQYAYGGDRASVLVGFGGIPFRTLPFAELDKMEKYDVIIDGFVPEGYPRLRPLSAFARPFKEILASVDIVVTKPGYGTVVESVQMKKPLVYVRRYNFADEPPLIEYLHRFGQAVELSRDDFFAGRWDEALRAITQVPLPQEPTPQSGVNEAALLLEKYLS